MQSYIKILEKSCFLYIALSSCSWLLCCLFVYLNLSDIPKHDFISDQNTFSPFVISHWKYPPTVRWITSKQDCLLLKTPSLHPRSRKDRQNMLQQILLKSTHFRCLTNFMKHTALRIFFSLVSYDKRNHPDINYTRNGINNVSSHIK